MKWIFSALIFAAAAFAQDAPELTPVEKAFQASMTNVVMQGYFTLGDSNELHDDRYVIERVSKVKEGMWKFEARVQYNKKDVKVSLNVPLIFAGDTPVISLTRAGVPGFGNAIFDTRLVIYKGAYAGTWGAGDHGGKMWGNIVKADAAEPSKQ